MGQNPSNSWNNLYRLKHAAADGMLIVCWCTLCRRGRTYLAKDLIDFYDPMKVVAEFNRWCGKHQSNDWTSTRPRFPSSNDVGHTKVLRPIGVHTTAIWREEWYGP